MHLSSLVSEGRNLVYLISVVNLDDYDSWVPDPVRFSWTQ